MRKILCLLLIASFLISSCFEFGKYVSGSTLREDAWTTKTGMHVARNNLGVVASNGKIYAIGGDTISGFWTYSMGLQNPSGSIVGTNEEYDPVTDSWTSKAPMPTPRASFAIASVNGKIYCIGGNSQLNQMYDPTTNTWENRKPIPTAITKIPANVVDGKIFIIDYYGNNYVYDPTTDSWETKAHTPTPSAAGFDGHVSAVIDGQLHIIGGLSSSGNSNLHQVYDPASDSWSVASTPSNSIGNAFADGAAASTCGIMALKRIYVFGQKGNLRQGEPDGTTRIYDPQKDSWAFGASLPTDRINFGVAVLNDTLYVVGGGKATSWFVGTLSPSAVIEQYTPFGYGVPDPAYAIEHTAPKINVLSPVNQSYNQSTIALLFTVDKPVNSTAYSIDAMDNVTVNGNTTMTNLSGGFHNITVYAKDPFGNIGASSSANFTVDLPTGSNPFLSLPAEVIASIAVIVGLGVGLWVYRRHRKASNSRTA